MIKFLFIFLLMSFLNSCQTTPSLTSNYTGGVTKEMMLHSTWQEINADFDGTFIIWEFVNENTINNIQRGASLEYSNWKEYTFPPGPSSPNPQNQGVFSMTSGAPGETLNQYLFVWVIDSAATKAVMQVFSTPEDILRFIANINAVHQANYQKVSP